MGMKAKTIKAVLQKKFNDFLDSIDDEEVAEAVKKNTIITGGSIANMLLGEKVNDYDLYFRNRRTVEKVAEYYVRKFNTLNPDTNIKPVVEADGDRVTVRIDSAGIASEETDDSTYEYFEQYTDDADATAASEYVSSAVGAVKNDGDSDKPRYRPVFMSTNAITLSNDIQLILRFYGEPDEIHENYDFVHCTNYWCSWDGHLELRKSALESLLAKELRYVGRKYPLCSVMRVRKFIARGWTITAGSIMKMLLHTNELELSDIKVLEDQLTGVDVAYFHEVLNKLKENEEVRRTGNVPHAYLFEILDRMF